MLRTACMMRRRCSSVRVSAMMSETVNASCQGTYQHKPLLANGFVVNPMCVPLACFSIMQGAGYHDCVTGGSPSACPLRIDMLSDSTRDRCPSEASAHWRSTLGSSETIRSDNRSALTSSNSEWFRRKCPPADVRRLHREHQSLENQAVIGV